MGVKSSVGMSRNHDPAMAMDEALRAARATLGRNLPRAALVMTTHPVDLEAARQRVTDALGPIPWAGGVVPGVLADDGVITAGAAVMCFSGEVLAPSIATSGPGEDLGAATDRVGRLVLAGAAYRRHYPRGMAVVFAGSGASIPGEFPTRWRALAGPRLRTVLNVLTGPAYHGPGVRPGGVLTTLCLEGAHQTGLGVATGLDGTAATRAMMVQCAAEAALSASKRLEGQPARAALVVESLERYQGLGAASRDEWAAVRERVGHDVPCVGWLAGSAYAFGRGVVAGGSANSVVVIVLGDVLGGREHAADLDDAGAD
jgi:hypothetical protein